MTPQPSHPCLSAPLSQEWPSPTFLPDTMQIGRDSVRNRGAVWTQGEGAGICRTTVTVGAAEVAISSPLAQPGWNGNFITYSATTIFFFFLKDFYFF